MFNSGGMTTSTSQLEQFIPSQHLSLLTQPVLASRSRLKKVRPLPVESDSGVDLSFSIPQPHIVLHRPLSALNEDSTGDEPSPVRLRFPPVSFGRNRSMEDILGHSSAEEREAQPRSSSFSTEREMKRSSDGLLLRERMSQHGKKDKRGYLVDALHLSSDITPDLLPTSQTVVRKPNTFTLKPLRKKTKFNLIDDSSSISTYEDSLTPRRTIKPKVTTIEESSRAPSNARSTTMDRQYPLPLTLHPRRGLLQQMVPFDASPSKKNNLLLRHHLPPAHRPTKPSLPLLTHERIRFKPTIQQKDPSEPLTSIPRAPLRLRNPPVHPFGSYRPSIGLSHVPRSKVTRIEPLVPNKPKFLVQPQQVPQRKASLHLSRPSSSSEEEEEEDHSRTYRLPSPPPVEREDSPISVKVTEENDGWSDDSAELLYVDERYLRERPTLKTSLSHLTTQENVLVHH